jgi:hypothetical protein
LPSLQFVITDQMSLLSPLNSNDRSIPLRGVACRPDSAQCQNHAFMLNAALMLSLSTCRNRQAWFLFCPHHGTAGLLIPNSAQYQNHAFMLNAAFMLSLSTCWDRQAWFLFCPHHGAAGLLPAEQRAIPESSLILCSMPRSCYHCPRAGTGKLGFSFVRITALLVS